MKEEIWLETDEARDVAGSIRHVLATKNAAKSDVHEWKWFALALHSSLQGACICHLVTSASPIGVVSEKDASKWLDFFRNQSQTLPRTRVLPLPELIDKIRLPNSVGDRSVADPIALDDGEADWIKSFHKQVRNQFVHFAPQGWSLEVSGLTELGVVIARVIGEILETGYAFRHLNSDEQQELIENLARLKVK